MKKLIFKKLTKDINSFFIIAILCTAIIVWVIQAVNFLDIVSEDGHSFSVYFLYTIFNLPKIVSKILPFIFLISLVNILLKYEKNNELIIFWLLGIGKIKFINALIKMSIFYFIIQISLTAFFVPYSLEKARSFFKTSNVDLFASVIKEKKFIDTVNNLTIFVEEKNGNELKRIMLKDRISEKESQIIISRSGTIITQNNKKNLILYNGKIINLLDNSQNIINFSEFKFDLSKFGTKTITMPKIQETSSRDLFICMKKITENPKFNSSDQTCEFKQKKNMIEELFKRFYSPVYIILIGFIASLTIINSSNNKNYTLINFLIFLTGVVLVIISEISLSYSALNIISTLIYILFPLVVLMIMYLSLIYKLKKKY